MIAYFETICCQALFGNLIVKEASYMFMPNSSFNLEG